PGEDGGAASGGQHRQPADPAARRFRRRPRPWLDARPAGSGVRGHLRLHPVADRSIRASAEGVRRALAEVRRSSMSHAITGARQELGRILAQQLERFRGGSVHINLSGQQANTLLHDGQAWRDFPRSALGATRRALRAAHSADATLFVHASFAFVHAVEGGARIDEPLRSCVEAILECEALAMSGPLPACVVRLGYLYGPQSADLIAYRKAFRLGRPYWSGSTAARQYHIHQFDAASALLAAARPRNIGKVYYATDDHAISFQH